MKYISILHSRYIINDSDKEFLICDNSEFIIDNNNNRLFHLFEMPEICDLYTIKLINESNILKVMINIDIEILKNMVLNGLHIPSRNLLFYFLRKNKNNQHLILDLLDSINIPVHYECNNKSEQFENKLNIKLYNYQIENNKWMLNLENNKNTYQYVDNNIIKIDNLYVDIEKERFLFNYQYREIKFDGGALIDSPGLGKCHLPETYIYINNKLIQSHEIWTKYSCNIIKNENEEFAKCTDLYINSLDEQTQKIKYNKISTLYRQKVNEKIKKVILSNGIELNITNKHKLLTSRGWSNNFTLNDMIAIPNTYVQTETITYNNDLIKLLVLKELNLIIELKHKCYIICKSKQQVSDFSSIILNYYNINGFIIKKDKYFKLEYMNKDIISNLSKYSLDTVLNSTIENKTIFINFLIELTNNKFYNKSYKKMLQVDIIAKSVNKYLQIKKCNRKYSFYVGKLINISNKNQISFSNIASIEYAVYNGYVYDYHIETDHNYIANNTICHNTICMISLSELNTSNLNIDQHNINLDLVKKDNEHLKSRATLILAPNHLCEQWKNEINDKSTIKHKIVLISTKRQFCNITYQDISLADFVIVSFQFLNNPEFKNRWKQYHSCYHHSIMDETLKTLAIEYVRNKNILQLTCPIFPLFHFHRLVVDECHELNNLKNHEYYYQLISLIKSDYRWCISGTPFQNGNIDFYNILNILTYNANTDWLLDQKIVSYIKKNLFRRNTNDSIRHEFTLNDINRIIIKLDFTIIEKIMYNSYISLHKKSKYNMYLKQLCCHPNLANKTKKALINCKTLKEINTGMIGYNTEILEQYNISLEKCNNDLQGNDLSKHKLESLLSKKIELINNIKKTEANIKYFKEVIPKINPESTTNKLDNCAICLTKIENDKICITPCGHTYCYECIYKSILIKKECPTCRTNIESSDLIKITNTQNKIDDIINKYGTKIGNLIEYLKNLLETTEERCIIFSQFDSLLGKVGKILTEYNINNIFCKGSVMRRNKSIHSFKYDDNFRVIMLSIKNTASGINLMCASTVIFLEPVYGTKDYIISTEKQAISRVYRIGQKKAINVVHFIIKDTLEEEIYDKYNK